MKHALETTRAPSRDLFGITCILLSGAGATGLPTSVRLAYGSGNDTITVTFARGVLAPASIILIEMRAQQAS